MFNFNDIISLISLFIGLQNLDLNQQQVDGLMSEMQNTQNTMLTKIVEQNEMIISQNLEIIKLLKEGK